ncbi:MAG: diguanylate cyclase [Bacilli bacterium]|nr:diguanylate cyclase [Bacilli bacterium]
MRYDFLLVALLFSMGALLLLIVVFSFTRRELMLGFVLIGLMALVNCIFLFGYGGFVLADDESAMLVFNHIQYLGIPFIYVLWFFVSVQQRTRRRMLPMKRLWFFLVIPVLALVTNIVYPWKAGADPLGIQKLYFISHTIAMEPRIGSGYDAILFLKGPIYYVLMVFNIIMASLSALNYYHVYKRSEAVYKRNLLILFVASLVLMLVIIIPLSSRNTAIIDTSPLFTGAFALLVFLALYKYEFFDLIPFAYRRVFQGASFPIFILDKQKTLISANNSAKDLFSERMNFREIVTLKDFNRFDKDFYQCLAENGEYELEFEVSGKKRYYQVKLEGLESNGKRHIGYILPFIDITEHRIEMERMEKIAAYDDLTRILNRRVFYEKASEAFDDAVLNKTPFSFIMFDLDDFKEINDIYGHQAGDQILTEMAELIACNLLESDIFARYGGEEFIIYCRAREPQDALRLAEHLRKVLEEHIFDFQNHKIRVTASFGVSGPKKQVTKSFERYIKDSDDGLYQAKSKGKNKAVIVS